MPFDETRPRAAETSIPPSPIPENWLGEPMDPRDVEEDLAIEWLPDHWLDRWRDLVGRMEPGDELRSYSGEECAEECELELWREGYALVRDGAVIDFLDHSRWWWG